MFKTYEFENFSFEIFNDPANKIAKVSQHALTRECAQLVTNQSRSTEIHINDIRHNLFDASTIIIGRDKSRHIFAFSTSDIIKIDLYYIIHLKYTAVSHAFQGEGFYFILLALKILEEARRIRQAYNFIDERHILLGTQTNNPLVYVHCRTHL
jgi:hypothetical protein